VSGTGHLRLLLEDAELRGMSVDDARREVDAIERTAYMLAEHMADGMPCAAPNNTATGLVQREVMTTLVSIRDEMRRRLLEG